jgi:hypothetical protein
MRKDPTRSPDPIKTFRSEGRAWTFSFIEQGWELTFIDENGDEVSKEIFVKKYLPRHEDGEFMEWPFPTFGIAEVKGKTGFLIEPMRSKLKAKPIPAQIVALLEERNGKANSVLIDNTPQSE